MTLKRFKSYLAEDNILADDNGVGTGLRANELREARTGDLDLARGYLRESRIAANAATPLFPTRTGDPFDVDGFAKLFARLRERSGIRTFSAHVLRHTWATNFMSVPGANLLELKRQGGWERWEMVEPPFAIGVEMERRARSARRH